MRYIWSPWRMKYILHQEHVSSCFFCEALTQTDNSENLILSRGLHTFLILNRYPYTGGHVMVVPKVHVPSVEDLTTQARAEVMEWIARSVTLLRDVYHPEAFNVGANIGAAAGAGIAEHMHFHVVPRWVGDTNFMSTVSGTRVLPEDLDSVYARMLAGWNNRFG
jgi:ATP adenylyltransferase